MNEMSGIIKVKVILNKDELLEKLSDGLAEKIENREACYTIDVIIDGHLDGVLNEMLEIDLVVSE